MKNFPNNALSVMILLFLIALVYVAYVFGLSILNPTEINWLFKGSDPAQHYLAWGFFKNESWHFPPGLITDFNITQPTSIGLNDSFPLLAFLFKPFAAFLPDDFHYFGWAILITVFLQLYVGFLWGKYLTERFILQLFIAVFLMLSPVFLFRLDNHIALASHWLILGGLYLYQKPWNLKEWLILTALSALIHPYLMVMLFALLFFNMLGNAHSHLKTRFVHFVFCALLALFLSYLCGHFVNRGSMGADYFGSYVMNLLSFFDSSFIATQSLTPRVFFGRTIFTDATQYLGFGVILLGLIAFYLRLRALLFKQNSPTIFNKENKGLFFVAFLLTFFALSPIIYFEYQTVFNLQWLYQLPGFTGLSRMFRANGRFGWVLFYILNVFILGSIVRRFSFKISVLILSSALILQIIDLNPKYAFVHYEHQNAKLNGEYWPQFPKEWQRYAQKGADLVLMTQSTAHQSDSNVYIADWRYYFKRILTPSYFAYQNKMRLNFNYSRSDLNKTNAFLFHHWDLLKKGTPAPNTLYVFLEDYSPADLQKSLPPEIYNQLLFQNTYALLPIQTKNDILHGQQ